MNTRPRITALVLFFTMMTSLKSQRSSLTVEVQILASFHLLRKETLINDVIGGVVVDVVGKFL